MRPYDYETFLDQHEQAAHQRALAFAREPHRIALHPPVPCYACGQPATQAILHGFECFPCCPQCAPAEPPSPDQPGADCGYTVPEAACILRIHPHVLSKKLHAGEIAGTKINGKWRIGQAELTRLRRLRFELQPADYVPLREAAHRLNVHYQTLLTWLAEGKLPAHRDPLSHGKQYFIPQQTMARVLELRSDGPSATPLNTTGCCVRNGKYLGTPSASQASLWQASKISPARRHHVRAGTNTQSQARW